MMYQETLESKMEPENLLAESMHIMFENKSNNCWLDASMVLIAHNKAMKIIAGYCPYSKLYDIISTYSNAVSILNDFDNNIDLRMKKVKEQLQKLQIHILEYLQPKLKCQNGEPDSAFCALLNLIYENKSIKEALSITYLWKKKCLVCNTSKLTQSVKPIITLSKVNYFSPECPTSLYLCSCKTEQEMKLIYKELPPCLLFHFENGAGKGENPPLFFGIEERKYQLTGVIILEKAQESNVDHFITLIRDPKTNKWLECNDLNPGIITFQLNCPKINLEEVYMYVYESSDNIGKMAIEISADYMQAQNLENANVELIDLSDESEDAKQGEMSSSLPNTKVFVNLPVHNSSTKPLSEIPKEKKLTEISDAVREKKTSECSTHLNICEEKIIKETDVSKGFGSLNKIRTQALKSNNKKNTITSVTQKITKEVQALTSRSNLTERQPISKAGQEKQSASCINILAKEDNKGSSSSKVNEESKQKIDYSKSLVKNLIFFKEDPLPILPGSSYKPTVTCVSSLAELQKLEKERRRKELEFAAKYTAGKKKTPLTSSEGNHYIKNTVSNLLDQKKNLQISSSGVSKKQSLNSDDSSLDQKKELQICSTDVSKMKNLNLDGSPLNQNNKLQIRSMDVSKMKSLNLDGGPLDQNKELQISSSDFSKIQRRSSDSSKKLDNMRYNISPVKKVFVGAAKKDTSFVIGVLSPVHKTDEEKLITNQLSDTCFEKNQKEQMLSKRSEISRVRMLKHYEFSKGINEMKTFENGEHKMLIEEKKSVEANNSVSVESNKRKGSSQQDMIKNLDGEFFVPSKVPKMLKRIKTNQNKSNELSESQVDIQHTSFKQYGRNRKCKAGSFEELSSIESEVEGKKRQNVNIIRVTAVENGTSGNRKGRYKNLKGLSTKSAKKSRKTLHESKLEKLVDVVVERSFAAFLEQVLHKHEVDL